MSPNPGLMRRPCGEEREPMLSAPMETLLSGTVVRPMAPELRDTCWFAQRVKNVARPRPSSACRGECDATFS
jgi:hypothetical protein